jgi:hypothetical protein
MEKVVALVVVRKTRGTMATIQVVVEKKELLLRSSNNILTKDDHVTP